ncbi:MAG: hypothetical protein ABFC80_02645 [Coriobacteriales bacterium]
MADTYEIVDGSIRVVSSDRIEIRELRARRDFWRDEVERIKADYQTQLAAAQDNLAAAKAALDAARAAGMEETR